VTGTLSPRASGSLALAGFGVVGGLASGHPELVVLAVPFILFLAVAVVLARKPLLRATLELERARILEGDETSAEVRLHNDGSSAVELELELLTGSQLALEPAGAVLVRVKAGAAAEIVFTARPTRWGVAAIGPLAVRTRSARDRDVEPTARAPRHAARLPPRAATP
jgi:uncharacterized protein (DUF58 family)